MKNFIDLIFYKTYLAYEAKNMSGRFLSCLYISFIFLFLCAPIYGFIHDLLIGIPKSAFKWLYVIYILIILGLVTRRYGKREAIFELVKKFRKHNKNKISPSWPYFLVLPISMVVGIGSYFLLYDYVIHRYELEGLLYEFFKS